MCQSEMHPLRVNEEGQELANSQKQGQKLTAGQRG